MLLHCHHIASSARALWSRGAPCSACAIEPALALPLFLARALDSSHDGAHQSVAQEGTHAAWLPSAADALFLAPYEGHVPSTLVMNITWEYEGCRGA